MIAQKKVASWRATRSDLTENNVNDYSNTPGEKEIIASYDAAKSFYVERERWHLRTANWYKRQSSIFLKKAEHNKSLAKIASDEAVAYWELAFDARQAVSRRESANG